MRRYQLTVDTFTAGSAPFIQPLLAGMSGEPVNECRFLWYVLHCVREDASQNNTVITAPTTSCTVLDWTAQIRPEATISAAAATPLCATVVVTTPMAATVLVAGSGELTEPFVPALVALLRRISRQRRLLARWRRFASRGLGGVGPILPSIRIVRASQLAS